MAPVLVQEHAALVHGLCVAAGIAAGAAVLALEVRRRGAADERLLVVVAGVVVGGALGMRAAGLVRLVQAGDASLLAQAWETGAKSVLGGLCGAYVGALVGKRLAGYPHRTGALFAPAVALGLAVGRLGCFLTEPVGQPTDLPWALRGAHPSFLYEIAFHAAALVVLLVLRDRLADPADLLVGYLTAYALFRLWVETTRTNDVLAVGLTGSQWVVLLALPLLLARCTRIRLARRQLRETQEPRHHGAVA
jgi:phosphatidylglycerol---prolipoprotein diacylglyceryl transferase